jgi:alkylhydroperoxidase family enzyme
MDINSAVGRDHGLNDPQIAAILAGREDGFEEPERLLLRLADAMAATPADVSEELFAQLRRHFSEEQLLELAAGAAQENYRARFNRVFDVGSDGLYCLLPEAASEPAVAVHTKS